MEKAKGRYRGRPGASMQELVNALEEFRPVRRALRLTLLAPDIGNCILDRRLASCHSSCIDSRSNGEGQSGQFLCNGLES
jgi:hypothetical protein